ncbi:MAG: class I SAM-dependent methyltransferase [Pseudomonadota bacterium]
MKTYSAFAHRLSPFNKPLFGDRARFGLVTDRSDPMWSEWAEVCSTFYEASQLSGFGKTINEAGYRILGDVDFTGKTVVEIGPGAGPHLPFFDSKPEHYILIDIREEFLVATSQKLADLGIPFETHLLDEATPYRLPLEDHSIDAMVTFYSLEHLYPLQPFVDEYRRVLRPGGQMVGAIPAEGGLAWGLGRFLTTRRWLKRNTSINPDKLICWEHPHFSDHILTTLSKAFTFDRLNYWPFRLPIIDTALILSFVATLRDDP